MKDRIAILVVNGFRPRTFDGRKEAIRYPWIDLCIKQVRRRSKSANIEIHVWDNSGLPEHLTILEGADRFYVWPVQDAMGQQVSHRQALDELATQVGDEFEYLVFLDTDAIPISDDWLEVMTNELEQGAALVGVWRDEMAPVLRPFVHPSCMCIRRSDMIGSGRSFQSDTSQDLGQNLTDEFVRIGRPIVGLSRTNAVNAHFLVGGIYGDLVYHHGAGSRPAAFWTSENAAGDEQVRVLLRDWAFRDFDHLIDVLQGKCANDIW